jgi:hypothetical protein
MPLSPIPSTLPTSTYEHLVLQALGEIAVGSTINYNPPILDTALFRHLVLNALQYIANNPGGAGSVTSITGGTGLSGGTITTSGTLAVIYGTTASTACQGNDSRLSDSRSPSGTAGGDLAGSYPNPTVDGLQGRPVSNATPVNGQVLQYDGANWVPGSIPSGGSGGGGVVYYLNFNTAADAPLTNIPQTPNATKELGIVGDVTATSYRSPILSTASYDFLASFVTDVSVPSSTTIPAGIWDFNIFVESTTTNSANQVYFKVEILKYDGVNAPTLLATSNDVYIYDPAEINQQIASVIMPQTTILSTDRIVVYLYGRAHQNNNRLTFHFGGNYPSHTHSTIPSVTGTGVAKVVNGVFQSPASTIVNADVSATAAIDVSKLSGVVAKAGDTMTGKLIAAATDTESKFNIGNAITGTSPTTTVNGDVWITNANRLAYRSNNDFYTSAALTLQNAFNQPQSIDVTSATTALRVTQRGAGEALRVEDDTTPDATAFVISNAGKVGIGVTPDASVALSVDTSGVKFGDGTIQTTAATGSGTVTSVTGTSPIASSGGATPAISIANAAADGATKGAAAFNASDFDATAGVVSIDYTNGQAASASVKGFLTSTDWTTFNSKGAGTVTSVSATAPLTSTGGATPVISTSMASQKLLGRGALGVGTAQEISIGTGLSLDITTLNNTGVLSNTTAAQGGTQLLNMVQITQAAYSAIVTPTANTLYIIVG